MCYASERLDKDYCQIQNWIDLVHICVAPKIIGHNNITMHENNCLYVAWASGFHVYENILTESRKYETLLKESYAVALDSCWVLTEKMLHGIEHDADSAYGVCIHYRHFWNFLHILMDTPQSN